MMATPDVLKTTFKTHSGHYEYLVMPFQILMNHIFEEHLRRFILVFFDDILVYSRSLEEHLQHLKITFELLAKHQLLKQSNLGMNLLY